MRSKTVRKAGGGGGGCLCFGGRECCCRLASWHGLGGGGSWRRLLSSSALCGPARARSELPLLSVTSVSRPLPRGKNKQTKKTRGRCDEAWWPLDGPPRAEAAPLSWDCPCQEKPSQDTCTRCGWWLAAGLSAPIAVGHVLAHSCVIDRKSGVRTGASLPGRRQCGLHARMGCPIGPRVRTAAFTSASTPANQGIVRVLLALTLRVCFGCAIWTRVW